MKEKTLSAVSVIIPCYNEEKFISKCLASVFANDYPSDKLKIMVIDGMSIDRTRLIVETFTKQYKNIRILENIHRFKSFALNLGIRESTSEVIMVLDAHSTYPSDYISKCVYYLNKHNADNAGGIWNILSSKQTLFGESIAITLGQADDRTPLGIGEDDGEGFICFLDCVVDNGYRYRSGLSSPKNDCRFADDSCVVCR